MLLRKWMMWLKIDRVSTSTITLAYLQQICRKTKVWNLHKTRKRNQSLKFNFLNRMTTKVPATATALMTSLENLIMKTMKFQRSKRSKSSWEEWVKSSLKRRLRKSIILSLSINMFKRTGLNRSSSKTKKKK